jgi:predicted small metal-binding protein
MGMRPFSINDNGGERVMAEAMKKLECPSPCNFSVKSHDEKEIIEMAKQHAKKSHNMEISEKDLKAMIKPA